jgi:hypothetical protein
MIRIHESGFVSNIYNLDILLQIQGKFQEKVQYFVNFNDLLPIGQQIFLKGPTNGMIRIQIHNPGLRIRGSGSVRNIYGSGTMLHKL